MKRVVCLYRVSTVGQVDHDDIPMQKIACREYVGTHPDWTIVKEVAEKGISGYKVSTNTRDAIVEIKKMAMAKEFDILLVFMFDRIGRRDDETPFVVQWFVTQGIEVWSTREGQQRFDSHVDKLLNYIRFWQASGESEKTSMRVRTRHSQMTMAGEYRGGSIPYGYQLVPMGRTNKKNQPMRDLAIDKNEAAIVRQIFHLMVDEGYGTNRTANWLNANNIPTKRKKTFWRGTAIRSIVQNPIYIGVLKFGDDRSEVFEALRIIDDHTFYRCAEIIRSRASKASDTRQIPLRTDTRGLLTGIIYCAHCGQRLTFCHQIDKKPLANGGIARYEWNQYKCYRKFTNRGSCNGQSTYVAAKIEEPILAAVLDYFINLKSQPEAEVMKRLHGEQCVIFETAYFEAKKAYDQAFKEMHALEGEAMKALTGQGGLDIEMVNAMLPRYRSNLEAAKQKMHDAQANLDQARDDVAKTAAVYQRMMSWADIFRSASIETKHMILAELIDRVDVGAGYTMNIRFRISAAQFIDDEE